MNKHLDCLNFNRHGAGRPVSPYSSVQAVALKQKVKRWSSRNLALARLDELQALGAALIEAGEQLAQVTSAGPRLLANVTNELARRGQEGANRE